MSVSRRSFLAASAAALWLSNARSRLLADDAGASRGAIGKAGGVIESVRSSDPSFDPRLEIEPAALIHNAREVARIGGDRPIMAVVKNNAYGLGIETAAPVLDDAPAVIGCAVVKPAAALALRDAGFQKPILVMGLVEDADAIELVGRDIHLSPFHDGAAEQLRRLAGRFQQQIPVHLYLDTGMSRLGVPFRRALPWIRGIAEGGDARIEGTFMGFAEEDDFDPIQLARFLEVAEAGRAEGIELGRLHAASSHALFHRPEAGLDMVRPGLVLYGAYPSGARDLNRADLRPAFRLRARVVRVERLSVGDSVSYGRNYIAERPTWIATLPLGHADGYPRTAVNGCEVLIGGELYRVIGAVSASHTIVELGEDARVRVGNEATLIGPDHEAIHPNAISERAGVSVYDVLMHLSAALPRARVSA
jgi:alanine racemase